MGFSPSADVYYGFDLGDMTDRDTWDSIKPDWMEEDRDWEEVLAEKFGWRAIPYPEDLCPKHPSTPINMTQYEESQQRYKEAKDAFYETPEYKAWSTNLRLKHQQAKAYGVVLGTYGYIDGNHYYVAISASVQHVGDWGTIELEPLVVGDDWDAKLVEFMRMMDLPIPAGESPRWYLNCSYG